MQSVADPEGGSECCIPNWGIKNTGHYNAVKTKVRQQLQMRYFLKIACLANCYNQKRFLTQNGERGAYGGGVREFTVLRRPRPYKWV